MATKLNPYLSFKDSAREAMEFYQSVFGGNLEISTFGESGMPHDPAEAAHVMHGMLTTDGGMTLMGSDTPSGMPAGPISNGSISISGEDEPELRRYYELLAEGGVMTMPLDKAPWGDLFGMCADKFGVNWLVNINGAGDTAQQPAAAVQPVTINDSAVPGGPVQI